MHARLPTAVTGIFAAALGLLLLAASGRLAGQNPPTSLTILSREGRRALNTTTLGGQERVALDDLATAFQLAIREEAGALTVSYKGAVIVLTTDQAMASVSGRLVSLSAPPVRSGGRWFVPIDFISRALAPLYDARLDLRRAARLLVVGDLRVPRVVVRQELAGNTGRITIEASPRATMSATQEGAQRVLVRFEADALETMLPPLPPQGVIAGIRVADPATLSIDLGARIGGLRSSTQALDNNSARLVLDLVPAQADTAAAPPTQPPPAPNQPPPPPVDRTSSLPTFELPGVRTLAIDPGHGGPDTGVRGKRGTLEKDVTLLVARRLKAAVEARLGLRVIMTREEDRPVGLDDRSASANYNKADLFISLHAGGAFRSTVTGAEVHHAAFDESSSTNAALVPERVPAFGGGYRDIELVPWGLAQIRHTEPSERMAGLVAQQLQGHVPLSPAPVQRTALRVLKSANMPAILIEMGYLTNPEQERQLLNPEFQSTIVQALVEAIARFREPAASGEGSPR